MFNIKIAENTIKGFNLGIFVIQFNPDEVNIPINEYGQTWLHLLAYHGSEFLAKLLIENKADLEATDKFGHTALHYAAMNAKSKIAKLLLDNGSLINARTLNGDTALHYASLAGHEDFMLFLLDQKVDKQAVNNDGLSALHYAIAMNKIEAAQTLLNKDIKITELADKDYSVLHVASAVGNPVMTTSIIEYKGGKELANLKDQTLHWTPIHFAKLARNAEVIELLKQNGAVDTPPIFSADGITALVETIRNTMCYTEKMVDTVTGGFAALSGATLTFGASKLLGLDQFRFATQLATKSSIWAVNTFVIKSIFKEWAALPIADSNTYDLFQDTYCKNIITDKIIHPTQVVSLRHADKFLNFNENDYLALGDSCKETDDTTLTKFNEFGFDWILCSGLVKENGLNHNEL